MSIKEYFSDIFPFILIEINAKGKIQNFNHQFQKQLLYDEVEIRKDLNLKDIISTGSKPVIESLLTNFEKFRGTDKIELRFKRKYGENFPAMFYYQEKGTSKKFEGLFCLILDISENKKIEYKYRQNQQRLRKVLDLVPHMIFLKDINGNILLANKAAADFYKTTTKNLVYSKLTDFHKSEKESTKILEEDKEVITKEITMLSNTIQTDLENHTHIFESTKVPFTDPESGQTHSLGIYMDVTEKRRFEQEIQETKEKYRLLVERGTDGILIIQDEKIVFANIQAAKLFGKTLEEFINQPLSSFIRKDHLKRAVEEYATDVQKKALDNYYEIKIYKADGEYAYGEAKISTINYEGKKSRLVFIRDITKRKTAEKSTERYKNMLEQAQKIAKLGSWEWNMQKGTLFCSEEIFRILEVENNTLAINNPRWLASFIPPHDKKIVEEKFVNLIRSGSCLDIEFPVIAENGVRKIIYSQSRVYKDSLGKTERVIGSWLDISERIRFEQILKEAKLKAEESDNLKSAFLANMSHEIRTPMNAILGFANLLKQRNLNHDTRLEYTEHILHSGEGLLKLINDIVDISKIESNQLKIENGPVLLNNILDQIYNRYEELLILSRRNTIRLSLEKALPDQFFTIVADVFRLQQIISNLLNNAIKFTTEGRIRFGYSIEAGNLLFFVEDEGIGIPEEKRNVIFKRFGKLDDPERMNKSGTGLGLSISKSLLELMGGKIWLASGEAGKTKFCFSIPLKFAQPVEKKETKHPDVAESKQLDLSEKTILIAEDELLNYKLLETLLLKTGAKVIWAKNGREAVQMAISENVHLVLMDIKMPEMNGYEATKAIKKINSNIPIIAQTAFAFSNEKEYILQSGCDMYITKPINHNEVYNALRYFLT